jgi:uncharacterized protein with NRDE domain
VCTIVVLRGVRADCPLILATNRDEFYARASTGPGLLLERPRTVGGRDLVAKGTWMGVTREGLFVGVTNHRTFAASMPARRSRGELVLHALSLGSAAEVSRYLRGLDAREYNPFNLMWGDANELHVAYGRTAQPELAFEQVPVGVHVLPNDHLDSASYVKVARARQLVLPLLDRELPRLRDGLQAMLSDRALPALSQVAEPPADSHLSRPMLRELSALCVRTPLYGTRSSTIVLLQPGRVQEFWFAEGPPDRAPFADVLPLY